jgi:hypothetical protein
MTASTTLPRYAHRRGTRGFAAFVTTLAGFVVLGVGAVVLPTVPLDPIAASWLIPLTIAFGLAHVVAAYGLIRRRAWSSRLVGYLAAIGIGIAAYGLILTLTGLDPFGATSTLPSARAWAEGVGLLVWMIGMWLVAARYAFKGIRPIAPGTVAAGISRQTAPRAVAGSISRPTTAWAAA